MEYDSATRREGKTLPFAATLTDMENVMLSEVSWTKANMCSLNINTNAYTKQKQTHRHRKLPKGKGRVEE